jgi:hypothetical protein
VATAGQIVDRCFRENNLLALGKLPSAAQAAEGLDYLNRVIQSTIGTDVGELLSDWPSPYAAVDNANYPLYPSEQRLTDEQVRAPPANSRILTTADTPTEIFFPKAPSDGARMALVNISNDFVTNPVTISANGRLIEGAVSIVINTQPTAPITWFYRADLSEWKRLTFPLLSTTSMPFPEHFDDFWVAYLALRIAPLYGKEPNAITSEIMKIGRDQFRQRYAQDIPVNILPTDRLFNSIQSYTNIGFWGV